MKTIKLLALLLLCNFANAQMIAVNTTDPETGNKFIITRNYDGGEMDLDDSVVKSGAVFFAVGCQSSKTAVKAVETYFIELDIIHNDNRLGCLQELNGKLLLTFEDGTEMECFQISPSDCNQNTYKAAYALMKRGSMPDEMKSNMQKVMATPIKKLTVFTTTKELEYTIKPKLRDQLMSHFLLIDKTVNNQK